MSNSFQGESRRILEERLKKLERGFEALEEWSNSVSELAIVLNEIIERRLKDGRD
jgi:hypothetical protein